MASGCKWDSDNTGGDAVNHGIETVALIEYLIGQVHFMREQRIQGWIWSTFALFDLLSAMGWLNI